MRDVSERGGILQIHITEQWVPGKNLFTLESTQQGTPVF